MITGYSGIEEIRGRNDEWVIDAYLPDPGTPTQPVEAGYMANAWVRMRHPDYDVLAGCSTTSAAPCTSMRADPPGVTLRPLLGPQRFLTTAGAVVRGLGVDGPVATITAGWEERESDDGELDAVLDGRASNLRLYARPRTSSTVTRRCADASLALRDAMDDLSGALHGRLDHGLDAVTRCGRRTGRDGRRRGGLDDAVDAVRRPSTVVPRRGPRALRRGVLPVWLSSAARSSTSTGPEVGRGRSTARSALAVAGGHVGYPAVDASSSSSGGAADLPVVAWSAGAMAMCDRVVLFHDTVARRGRELWDRGLGRRPRRGRPSPRSAPACTWTTGADAGAGPPV